jgi:hypothetical protein
MQQSISLSPARLLRCGFLWLFSVPSLFGAWPTDIGYDRLPGAFPGAPQSVAAGVSQIEAPLGPAEVYMPDTALSLFSGKTFTDKTGGGTVSWHATNVGVIFYGNGGYSTLPLAAEIDIYSASDWLGMGFLGNGSSAAPLAESRSVENHSWVSTTTNAAAIEDVNQRLDFAVNQSGFVAVVGMNNGFSTTLPGLLCQAYNVISVGRTDGEHSAGFTAFDGVGRVKPDLVVPESLTSYATGRVSSAAGVLAERVSQSPYSLSGAALPRAVKALLLAGATKEEISGWSRTSAQPLDSRYGAGELNLLLSYGILESGQVSPSTSALVPETAWSGSSSLAGGTQHTYFFDVPVGSANARFSAALIWHRTVTDGTPSPLSWSPSAAPLPNLKVELRNASGFTPGTLVDESDSAVDNVEHLYQANLAPGSYVLVVSSPSGTATTGYALAWRTLPTVSVAATIPQAGEQGPVAGQFTVSRTGSTAVPLYVPLAVSGTAASGADYTALPSTVVIPAGSASATVDVAPLADALAEGPESVILTVSADYSFSGGGSAQVDIADWPVDQWRFENFTAEELEEPLVSGLEADPEGDGLSNLLEYALGGDPKSPVPAVLPVLDEDGTYLTLAFSRVADPELTYAVWASADLSNWGVEPIWSSTGAQNIAGPVMVTDTQPMASQPRRFLRLRVTLPD